MQEIIAFFKQPEFYAAVLATIAALRGIGEALLAIGKLIEGPDPLEKSGNLILKIVKKAANILNYLGIGNKK